MRRLFESFWARPKRGACTFHDVWVLQFLRAFAFVFLFALFRRFVAHLLHFDILVLSYARHDMGVWVGNVDKLSFIGEHACMRDLTSKRSLTGSWCL